MEIAEQAGYSRAKEMEIAEAVARLGENVIKTLGELTHSIKTLPLGEMTHSIKTLGEMIAEAVARLGENVKKTLGEMTHSIKTLGEKFEPLMERVEKFEAFMERVERSLSEAIDRSVSELAEQVTSASGSAGLSDSAFGSIVRGNATLNKQHQIVPPPLSMRDADKILMRKSPDKDSRFTQPQFKSWMTKIQQHKCHFEIRFSGDDNEADQGWKKGDFTIIPKNDLCIPVNTVAVLSLQSSSGLYNSSKDLGLVIRRAEHIIRRSGPDRRYCIAGLTDGVRVQWFLVEHLLNTERYLHYQSSEFDFRLSLCSVLTSDPVHLYFNKVEPKLIGGKRLVLKQCLGFGATSKVYACDYDNQNVVAKVYRHNFSPATEHAMLERVKTVSNIPIVIARSDELLVMKPVGETLSSAFCIEKKYATKMSNLVDTLQQAHSLGVVHRDVRPLNILKVPEGPNVVLIDWGFAAQSGKKVAFAGSFITASSSILSQLSKGRNDTMPPPAKKSKKHVNTSEGSTSGGVGLPRSKSRGISVGASGNLETEVMFKPEDDLSSLVRTLFLFSKKGERLPDCTEGIRMFWEKEFEECEAYLEAERFALNCDYDALRAWVDKWAQMTVTSNS